MFIDKSIEISSKTDPFNKETIYSQTSSEASAIDLSNWVEMYKSSNSHLIHGGVRDGRTISPTIIEANFDEKIEYNLPLHSPICLLYKFSDIDDAIESLCSFGLGSIVILFSHEQDDALRILKTADIGTLIMNEYSYEMEPSVLYRTSYKQGGSAVGIRFAIKEFTEERTLLFNNWWGG